MDGSIPTSIGRYQIVDRLAVGGMAELYKARLTAAHGFAKPVVIKKMLPHLAREQAFVEMFHEEARIAAQLDHNHIVQVFELGTDADTPYIAMQLVDGFDVLALLRECTRTQIRLPAELAALIARDLLDALEFAHTALDIHGRPLGIVHRDISPGNVLVSWRGDVKLTDFGIARATTSAARPDGGQLKGKYGYMSPEQVSGGEIDARSDLFSAGIVLAEMVMARRLFTSTNDLDVLLLVRDARLDRLHRYASEFPAELRAITIRALQRRPEHRFQTAAQFRDALDDYVRRVGVGRRDLATLIGRVASSPSADAADAGAAPWEPEDLVGPAPDASLDELELERVAEDDGPSEVGDLRDEPSMRLLYRLARAQGTGLLTLEGRAGTLKETYLLEGQPQYVQSNVENERLGPFLVASGALTQSALERALGVMHQFGGHLADTLVGLDLMDPLDAYRLLAQQVAAKLTETFSWQRGRYTWRPESRNPYRTRPLHLDAFRVIGAGAASLAEVLVEDWGRAHATAFVVAEHDSAGSLAQFGLGDALLRVHSMLDGRTRLGELGARVRSRDARLNLLRLTYLLVHTDHARLS